MVNQSLALDPDFLLALETKGEILRRYARFEEVIVTMDHALELAPDDVSALNLMANALRTTGQFDRLLEITQRLMLSPLKVHFPGTSIYPLYAVHHTLKKQMRPLIKSWNSIQPTCATG